MLTSMFIIFQIVALIFFMYGMLGKGVGNETKTLISLIISVVLFAMLMVASWNVEVYNYQATFDGVNFDGYEIETTHKAWPIVGATNIMFFSLGLLFTLFDIFSFIKEMNMGPTNKDTRISGGGL